MGQLLLLAVGALFVLGLLKSLVGGAGGQAGDARADARSFAEREVTRSLRDPDSARFQQVRTYRRNDDLRYTVCGEVNAKNGFGGFNGFMPFVAYVDMDPLDGIGTRRGRTSAVIADRTTLATIRDVSTAACREDAASPPTSR